MKKLLFIFSMLMSFVLCHAQLYDPSIPSQQVPYAKQNLSSIIKDIKAALPIQTDEITYWEDAYISKKSGNVVFKYVVDDSSISMADFNMATIKKQIIESLKNDESNANLAWDIYVLKKNLVYLYVGYHSKKQRTITLTCNDIRKAWNLVD